MIEQHSYFYVVSKETNQLCKPAIFKLTGFNRFYKKVYQNMKKLLTDKN